MQLKIVNVKNSVSLRPAGVLRCIKITLTINYLLYKTKGGDMTGSGFCSLYKTKLFWKKQVPNKIQILRALCMIFKRVGVWVQMLSGVPSNVGKQKNCLFVDIFIRSKFLSLSLLSRHERKFCQRLECKLFMMALPVSSHFNCFWRGWINVYKQKERNLGRKHARDAYIREQTLRTTSWDTFTYRLKPVQILLKWLKNQNGKKKHFFWMQKIGNLMENSVWKRGNRSTKNQVPLTQLID